MNLRSMNEFSFVTVRKIVVLSLMVLGVLSSTSESGFAQSPQVEFSPYGEARLCKGCDHWKMDVWEVKYRVKNVSDRDIVVFGTKDSDGTFDLATEVQYRNQHTCEWEYWYGESKNRVQWQGRPDYYKVPMVLKPGETLEAAGGLGGYGSILGRPVRRALYVSFVVDDVPIEVFSLPLNYVLPKKGENLTYQIVEDRCVRNCKMDTFVPTIQGVKLGMTVKEFQALFPDKQVDYIRKELEWGRILVWDKKSSKWSMTVSFLNEKVEQIEPSFPSLYGTGKWPDIYQRVAKLIGMTDYVAPDNGGWRCSDFIIDVVDNDDPIITISSKKYEEFQAERNEESFKKPR